MGFEVVGVDGEAFRVTEEGEGQAILLIHGGSNHPGDWDRVARALAKRFRALRYTRFTYRSDPPPRGPEAMAGEVHDVLAISEALRWARRAIEERDADGAVDIFLREIVEVPGYLVGALRLVKPVWRRLLEYAPAQIADTEAIDSLGVGLERYRDVRVPVLLLGGGFLSPPHAGTRLDALADALPIVESRVTLRLVGHGAHYSAPQTVARIIGGFVERVAGNP